MCHSVRVSRGVAGEVRNAEEVREHMAHTASGAAAVPGARAMVAALGIAAAATESPGRKPGTGPPRQAGGLPGLRVGSAGPEWARHGCRVVNLDPVEL